MAIFFHVERELHAIGRVAQEKDGHRHRYCRDRHQREAGDVIREAWNRVAHPEPYGARAAGSGILIAGGERRFGGAQQGDGQQHPPGNPDQIGRPGAADIPRAADDDRCDRGAEPREEVEAAEMFRVAIGQLRDQGLRSRPAERQRAAIDDLQQHQGPERRHQRKHRRQRDRGPHEKQRDAPRTKAIHQHADMDRQEEGEQMAPAGQRPDLAGAHAERQGVERDQEDV